MRSCRRCKVEREDAMFYLDLEARKSAKVGYAWQHYCRICAREVADARKRPRLEYTDSIKLERGCADCGIRSPYPEIYDFDHKPGEVKVKTVAAWLTSGTMDDLKDEIERCDVVCANCHRIRTRGRVHGAFGRGRR